MIMAAEIANINASMLRFTNSIIEVNPLQISAKACWFIAASNDTYMAFKNLLSKKRLVIINSAPKIQTENVSIPVAFSKTLAK